MQKEINLNYQEAISKFDKYVMENYEFNNELIYVKHIHTLYVVKIILLICNKLKLDEKDCNLAFFIALFHDLGRFREVVRRGEFNNLKFDHGAYSNKILFNDGFIKNFSIKEEDYLLIRKAIYYHNKKDLPDNLNERELFFVKLIRDADRIDIFRVLSYNENLFEGISSDRLLNNFYNGESIDIKNLKTRGDRVLLRFDFVKLFGFNESKQVLNELGYFERYVKSIKVNDNVKELFDSLVEEINRMLKGEENYVGKKI